MLGVPRMLVPHGALEMASACPRSNFSALCSRPTCEPCVVAGMSIAYGSYSVHTGRRAAHGAGLGARGGRIVKMNVPVHVLFGTSQIEKDESYNYDKRVARVMMRGCDPGPAAGHNASLFSACMRL